MSAKAQLTVTLRAMRLDDAAEVVRIAGDEEVARYTLFPQVTEEEVRSWLRDREGADAEFQKYRWWGIEAAGRAKLAGFCGLVMEPMYEAAELWYLLDKPWWGQGMGTQAARLVVDKGFREFGLHRIYAYVCPPNEASVRILEKIGMRREGLVKRNLKIQGEWTDSYLYAVLRDEWMAGSEEPS